MPTCLPKLHKKTGQSLLEYSTILILVMAAIIVGGPYVIRSWNAHMKGWEDSAQDSFAEHIEQSPPTVVTLPGGCNCSDWGPACSSTPNCSCGLGGCPIGEKNEIKSCAPVNCDAGFPPGTTSRCVPDPGCCSDIPLAGDANCGANASCNTNPPNPPSPCLNGQRCNNHICGSGPPQICKADSSCIFQCQGSFPLPSPRGQVCLGDDTGLTNNSTPVSFVSACTPTKCEFQCQPPWVPGAGNCVCPAGTIERPAIPSVCERDYSISCTSYATSATCAAVPGCNWVLGSGPSCRTGGTICGSCPMANPGCCDTRVNCTDPIIGCCSRNWTEQDPPSGFGPSRCICSAGTILPHCAGTPICNQPDQASCESRPACNWIPGTVLSCVNAAVCTWTGYLCGDMSCPNGSYIGGVWRPLGGNEACWGAGNDYDEGWTRLYCCAYSISTSSCYWTPQQCGPITCNPGYYVKDVKRPTSPNEFCWGAGNDYDEPWTQLYCCLNPGLNQSNCNWTGGNCGVRICANNYYMAGWDRPRTGPDPLENCGGNGNDRDEPYTSIYCCEF